MYIYIYVAMWSFDLASRQNGQSLPRFFSLLHGFPLFIAVQTQSWNNLRVVFLGVKISTYLFFAKPHPYNRHGY